MTYKQFVDKWRGKHCEMGGSAVATNQCVDLANAYIKEVLGLPIVLGTNAVDFPKKCLAPDYEFIKNSVTAVPKQGDIMIYKSPDGIGHIDIFDNGNDTKFVAFSQNWPVGSVCKMVNHTYTGTYSVVGWLRGIIKELPVEETMTNEEKIMLQFIRDNKITEGLLRQGQGYITDNIDKKVSDLEALVYKRDEEIVRLNDKLTEEHKVSVGWQNKCRTANDEIKSLNQQLLSATDKLTVNQLFKLIVKKLTKK